MGSFNERTSASDNFINFTYYGDDNTLSRSLVVNITGVYGFFNSVSNYFYLSREGPSSCGFSLSGYNFLELQIENPSNNLDFNLTINHMASNCVSRDSFSTIKLSTLIQINRTEISYNPQNRQTYHIPLNIFAIDLTQVQGFTFDSASTNPSWLSIRRIAAYNVSCLVRNMNFSYSLPEVYSKKHVYRPAYNDTGALSIDQKYNVIFEFIDNKILHFVPSRRGYIQSSIVFRFEKTNITDYRNIVFILKGPLLALFDIQVDNILIRSSQFLNASSFAHNSSAIYVPTSLIPTNIFSNISLVNFSPSGASFFLSDIFLLGQDATLPTSPQPSISSTMATLIQTISAIYSSSIFSNSILSNGDLSYTTPISSMSQTLKPTEQKLGQVDFNIVIILTGSIAGFFVISSAWTMIAILRRRKRQAIEEKNVSNSKNVLLNSTKKIDIAANTPVRSPSAMADSQKLFETNVKTREAAIANDYQSPKIVLGRNKSHINVGEVSSPEIPTTPTKIVLKKVDGKSKMTLSESNIIKNEPFDQTLAISSTVMSVPGYAEIDPERDVTVIGDVIGYGASSDVYRGKLLNRKFAPEVEDIAIKAFNDSYSKNAFLMEVAIHSGLKHQNVARFVGFTSQPMCMVLKFYETNVFDIISNRKDRITEQYVLHVMQSIISGMAFIHSKGIVHFDLKPRNYILYFESENILISDEECVISDFGLARMVDSIFHDKLVAGIEKEDKLGLTISYASPEVKLKEKNVTEEHKAVDVYSFGIILYELIHKRRAWHELLQSEENATENIIRHASGQNLMRTSIRVSPI
ncbi:hypothetical protein ROZALSC1DRAFT_23713 [Rozella allomycis CSF55]|uniref:Protein kinase domain-containing protein n=1 Tax=Rozella allomycis (strain CSF55) TaxID=988480 RepID=A0A4P9YER3_ROZAC|nr:hypothetical protein ROZALSC1DRAFT_23713 [Rozella allomycis CSF55]